MLVPATQMPTSCPFEKPVSGAVVAPPTGEVRDSVDLTTDKDLAPCHDWLVDKPHTPVPTFPASAWQNAKHYDVVVVGAGMGGLYTAWRLRGCDGSPPPQGKTQAPNVCVFERTHHIGGRARTVKSGGTQTPFDLGAMRFIPSQHLRVNALAEHFHIPTRDFVVGGDKNLQYFRGVRLTNEQAAHDPSSLPFNLTPNERGKSADELLSMAIETVVPNFRKMGPQEWAKAKRNTIVKIADPGTGETVGVPLYQLGLQNVLSLTLSREAIALVTDSVGYQSYLQNWDAGQALEGIAGDFRSGTTYRTPINGMGAFPRALAADLRKAGTEFRAEQTLRNLDYDREKKQFRLAFESLDGTATPIVADQVVLAMPQIPLKELVGDSPLLQGTALESNLNKVTANPMTRIFVTYDKPWWNNIGIKAGRSVTDLPLGQVYYYGADGDKHPYLEVYADGTNSQYWEGLQDPSAPGVATKLCAKPQLAKELQHELQTLHGIDIRAPTGFLYKRWADPFTGGAYHTWNVGSKPFETAEAMIAPVSGLPLFVCGEAFSTEQGWIEGALETSEKVLARMGKPPSPSTPS